MKKRFIFSALLVLFVIVLTGYFLFAVPEQPKDKNPYLTDVALRDVAVEVRTLGTLEAKTSHMISSQIRGPGAKLIYLAPNGTFVSKNEILVRFDSKPFEDSVTELAGQLETLEAGVKATQQLVEWEKNEAMQRIVTAEYKHKIAGLDLKRLVEGEGPLKLAQYKDELDKADLELTHFKAYRKDLQQLEREGIANPSELERIGENLKVLQDKYRSAKRQFDSYQKYVLPVMVESAREKVKNSELLIQQMKQSSVHKIANAQATLEQARGKLKAVRLSLVKAGDELEKTVIKAPFDGLIIHYETFRNGELRGPREGDTVIINQPIMYFPDISSLVVKSRVREIDLHRIRMKQQATIYVDAYPEDTFAGELFFIGALAKKRANSSSGEKYFQVVFSLNGVDERLRPGMSARVIVHVAELKGVPTIPVQSVFRDNGGEFCYLWNGVLYEKRYITTGRYNEDYIEIKRGLQLGDTVSQVDPEHML